MNNPFRPPHAVDESVVDVSGESRGDLPWHPSLTALIAAAGFLFLSNLYAGWIYRTGDLTTIWLALLMTLAVYRALAAWRPKWWQHYLLLPILVGLLTGTCWYVAVLLKQGGPRSIAFLATGMLFISSLVLIPFWVTLALARGMDWLGKRGRAVFDRVSAMDAVQRQAGAWIVPWLVHFSLTSIGDFGRSRHVDSDLISIIDLAVFGLVFARQWACQRRVLQGPKVAAKAAFTTLLVAVAIGLLVVIPIAGVKAVIYPFPRDQIRSIEVIAITLLGCFAGYLMSSFQRAKMQPHGS